MAQLQELHDFLVRCIVEELKIAHSVEENIDGEWPAEWYQGGGSFPTYILASATGPDFDAGTPARAAFVVRNDPAHVLKYLDYLRWTVKQHEPVLTAAEQDSETVAMEVCPTDGEECEPLLQMASIFADRPGFKKDWQLP